MCIKSMALFLCFSSTSNINLNMDLPVLHKIPISLSFRHHASPSYRIAGLVNSLISISGNLLTYSNFPHSINVTNPHFIQAVTKVSHSPVALIMSPRYVNFLVISTYCIIHTNLSYLYSHLYSHLYYHLYSHLYSLPLLSCLRTHKVKLTIGHAILCNATTDKVAVKSLYPSSDLIQLSQSSRQDHQHMATHMTHGLPIQ